MTFFIISTVFLAGANHLQAQALRDINYSYLYNPEEFRVVMKPVRQPGGWEVFFDFRTTDSVSISDRYVIAWHWRQALSSKEGVELDSADRSTWKQRGRSMTGRVLVPVRFTSGILAASITDRATNKSAWYYTTLLENYPVTNYLEASDGMVAVNSYVDTKESFTIRETQDPVTVSYYNDGFPAAAPAFSEAMARVPAGIKADSVFTVPGGTSIKFSKRGLYLVQRDTSSGEGFAFRAEADYPKYGKLENLSSPLIYITTKQEYEKLKLAQGDKKAFDKVILGLTKDADRARTFMRNYFRRVEMANQLFTSYKEGWKTDRGMIYIIFGAPTSVYKSENNEAWKYDNSQFKISFNFVRSATLFDPENYVLVRESSVQRKWYEVIDLWRNVRF